MNNSNRPSFRERIARFMMGRRGPDALYHFTIALTFIIIVINLFVNSLILSLLEFALLFFATFRFLSRNVYNRQKENDVFLKIINKPLGFFKMNKVKHRDRKTHVFKKCPSCKNTLRLPKEKGEHTVVCPCCKHRFNVKI